MEVVRPYAELLEIPDREAGIVLLRKIEFCARISHRSEEAQTPDSWERFLTSVVLRHGDFSVIEHCSCTVDAVVDRGIQQEWTRHRLFGFTAESTRFVPYGQKHPMRFIEPPGLDDGGLLTWQHAMEASEAAYLTLIESKDTPQIARSVLPLALASRMIVTGNLRNWRHFLNLCTTKETHPQFKQITISLLQQFKERIPLLFQDIIENDTQANAMKRPR